MQAYRARQASFELSLSHDYVPCRQGLRYFEIYIPITNNLRKASQGTALFEVEIDSQGGSRLQVNEMVGNIYGKISLINTGWHWELYDI